MYIEEKVENILKQLDRLTKTMLDLNQQLQDLRLQMDLNKGAQPGPYLPWSGDPFRKYYAANECQVCGMKWDGPMGYVCNNERCPTRVTSVSTTMTVPLSGQSNSTYYATYGDKFTSNTLFSVQDGHITGQKK